MESSVIHLSATNAERPEKNPDVWEASFDERAHLEDRTATQRLTAHKSLTLLESTEKKIVKDMAARVRDIFEKPEPSEKPDDSPNESEDHRVQTRNPGYESRPADARKSPIAAERAS